MLRASDLSTLLPGEYPLVRCLDCQMVYVNPRPVAEDISYYYPDHYWIEPPGEEERPFCDRATRQSIDLLARRFPGGRGLDVGCGVGVIAALMRKAGLRPVGLDPYEHACRVAREQYGLEVVCGYLHEANLPDCSFDAVTFFDVLEHTYDPVAELKEARRLLNFGGLVIVKVPNIQALQARVFGRWWYCLDVPRHLSFFSPATLRHALEKAGFDVVVVRAVPDWVGALTFRTSLLYWLRGRALGRSGGELVARPGEAPKDVLA
ncbi:MAG: class I SAM-dependent methyltransferase, partial [Armatimonadetes bacterium]|nr:class I SAM-dependent methyltransferase [Armatimonadota bacterium]